jgi:FKBP-type peptidyl-prolyl cis-trans isomerase FkpA
VFDQSDAAGISFPLNGVIKVGPRFLILKKGKRYSINSSHLGYGSSNYSGIPGGSVLLFDVKLISVN